MVVKLVCNESQMQASWALVLDGDVNCSELILSDPIPTQGTKSLLLRNGGLLCFTATQASFALLSSFPHSFLFFLNVEWNNQL